MKIVDTPARVLVADDDPTMGLLMRAALEELGYQVIVMTDGATALADFCAHRADIVLLDVEMPEFNGYEVCEEIRRLDPEVPVVLVTGHDEETSIAHAKAAGATDFISKPINWTLIGHRVRYILQRTRDAKHFFESKAQTVTERISHAKAGVKP